MVRSAAAGRARAPRAPRELEIFVRFLKSRGQRVTAERRALCAAIFDQHGHLDAEQLLSALAAAGHAVSRATVYRNLDLLVECGLVQRYRLGGSRFLYEHLHAEQQHHHLACRGCGRVAEFVSPGIAAMVGEICRAHGFEAGAHDLQILGLCSACAARGVAAGER